MIRVTAALALLLVASAYRVRRDTSADIKAMVENSFKSLRESLREGELKFEQKCKSVFDENAAFIGFVDGSTMEAIHDGNEEICNTIKHKAEMFKDSTKMDFTVDYLVEFGESAIVFAKLTISHASPSDAETDETEMMKSLTNAMRILRELTIAGYTLVKKVGRSMKVHVAGVFGSGDHQGHHHHGHGHDDSHGHRVRRDTAGEKLGALMARVKQLQAEGKLDEITDLLYDDDVRMYTPKGELIQGKAAVRELRKKEGEKYGRPQKMMVKHVIEEGNIVIVIGERTLAITQDGEEKQQKATFIAVLKAEGDSYKAIAHANFYVHRHSDNAEN